jgi:hypothetical protein
MRSNPTPTPPPGDDARTDQAKKARLLLPIIISVAVLAVFLLLFLPSRHGKKAHGGSRGGSGLGNSSVTEEETGKAEDGNGRGNGDNGGKGAQGETWWYRNGGDKAKGAKGGNAGDGDAWWAPDKSGSGKSAPAKSSESPVGGD